MDREKRFEPARQKAQEIDSWKSIVATTIIAAAGVNLIVAGISPLDSCWLIVVGILLCLLSMGRLLLKSLSSLNNRYTIRGFFLIDKTKHEMIHVPGYDISLEMWLQLKSAEAERKDIINDWNTEKFGDVEYRKDNGYHIEVVETKANAVFIELLEYCVLKMLSSHLTNYFSEFNENEVVTLKREDVPEILKANRFLDWLSEVKYDMERERDIMFSDLPPDKMIRELQKIWPKGSHSFSFFEMKIPKGGQLKLENNTIVIEHDLFSVSLECNFSASDPSLPQGFSEYYIGIPKDDGKHRAFQYSITVTVNFKYRAMLLNKWRKYYYWIDSFVKSLNEIISQEDFFERIGWNTAYTVIICNQLRNREKETNP